MEKTKKRIVLKKEGGKQMKEIMLKARAKINLTLDVTGKREDGYHTLKMIMQTVALYDGVYLKKIDKPMIKMKTNLEWLPIDERNLAYRAAQLLRDAYHIKEGVFIQLDKRIPVAAGLAGGSADCAAVLFGMNRLFRLRLSEKELMAFALKLGTDIPYCIMRSTALAEGVGEILTPIVPSCPKFHIVLAKLPVSVSTAFIYGNLSLPMMGKHPDTEKMLNCIKNQDIEGIGKNLCNVLETATIPMHPRIQKIKDDLVKMGAEGALMSGSGPTVFGIFKEKDTAKKAASMLRRTYHMKDVFVTEIYNEMKKRG